MKITRNKSLTSSPCTGALCSTMLGDDICKGCGRTFKEVTEWNTYTDKQKIKINQRLKRQQK